MKWNWNDELTYCDHVINNLLVKNIFVNFKLVINAYRNKQLLTDFAAEVICLQLLKFVLCQLFSYHLNGVTVFHFIIFYFVLTFIVLNELLFLKTEINTRCYVMLQYPYSYLQICFLTVKIIIYINWNISNSI